MTVSDKVLAAKAFGAGVLSALLMFVVYNHAKAYARKTTDSLDEIKIQAKIEEGQACVMAVRYGKALEKGCKISQDGKWINCPEDGSVTMGDIFGQHPRVK